MFFKTGSTAQKSEQAILTFRSHVRVHASYATHLHCEQIVLFKTLFKRQQTEMQLQTDVRQIQQMSIKNVCQFKDSSTVVKVARQPLNHLVPLQNQLLQCACMVSPVPLMAK